MAPYSSFSEEKKDESDEFLEYELSIASACDRVRMLVDQFGADSVTLLTSFGVQSGVMLSTVAEACPDVRVLYIDTQGPTSDRDLEYGRKVLDTVGLKNFSVAKAGVTREEFQKGMEEVGITADSNEDGNSAFHALSQEVFKLTPLKQECATSNVQCLLSGVRRGQTSERDHFKFLQYSQAGPDKAHPILDWSDEQCLAYLSLKGIPQHPELGGILTAINAPDNKNDSNTRMMRRTSSLRSRRLSDRGEGKECGIHVQAESNSQGKHPVPTLPNIVVGKVKCRFCVATKNLLSDSGVDYVEAPVHLFPHLIPAGTATVPIVYLNKQLIGGYGDLCDYLKVEDTLNTK